MIKINDVSNKKAKNIHCNIKKKYSDEFDLLIRLEGQQLKVKL
jgi:hypothetical protein